jgi:hypothetical protein
MFGPPRRFCKILISRLIFFFLTGCKDAHRENNETQDSIDGYFKNFNHHFLVIDDIDTFEHFTVLSSTELAHDLIIVLITMNKSRWKGRNSHCTFDLPPLNNVQLVVVVFARGIRRWQVISWKGICLPWSVRVAIGIDASSTRLSHQKPTDDNGQPKQRKKKGTMDLQERPKLRSTDQRTAHGWWLFGRQVK